MKYTQIPWDAFEREVGYEFTVMFRWFETRGFHVDLEAVKQEYPHTTDFNRWLETYWRAPDLTREAIVTSA